MTVLIKEKKSITEILESAKGAAAFFEKSSDKKKYVKSEPKEETKPADSKQYNESLQKTLSESKKDDDDENVEL